MTALTMRPARARIRPASVVSFLAMLVVTALVLLPIASGTTATSEPAIMTP
jgi:hypothetical protein